MARALYGYDCMMTLSGHKHVKKRVISLLRCLFIYEAYPCFLVHVGLSCNQTLLFHARSSKSCQMFINHFRGHADIALLATTSKCCQTPKQVKYSC